MSGNFKGSVAVSMNSNISTGPIYRISGQKLRELGAPVKEKDDLPRALFEAEYLDQAGKSVLIDDDHVLRPSVTIDYTNDERRLWADMFAGIENLAPRHDIADVAKGYSWIRSLGGADRIPLLDEMNPDIKRESGFELVPVIGLLSDDRFFKLLMDSKFPVTLSLRGAIDRSYTYFPDIFHDLAGHGTMFLNDRFSDFVRKIGALGFGFKGQRNLQKMVALLYWYTIEFGLKRETGLRGEKSLRVYGAGIISSEAETKASVTAQRTPDASHRKIHRLEFNLKRLLLSHYEYERPQDLYFVIDDYAQLTRLFDNDPAGFIKDLAADVAAGREHPIAQGESHSSDVEVGI